MLLDFLDINQVVIVLENRIDFSVEREYQTSASFAKKRFLMCQLFPTTSLIVKVWVVTPNTFKVVLRFCNLSLERLLSRR